MNVNRRTDLLICLSLIMLAGLVFGQTIDHDFVGYDDPFYVTDQPIVQRGVTAEGFIWAFRHGADAAYWTPITYLSHMLDVELFGMRPGMHHLSSVVLHAVNAVLLYLLLLGVTGARWSSALVGAWFAIHPLRVESVAWIAERKDLVSGLFFLLTLAAYAAYARRGGAWRYGLVLLLFALGLMSKPMLVTLPAVLLLLDAWPLQRAAPWKRLVVEKLPLVLMSLGIALFAILAQGQAGAVRSLEQFPIGFRISNAIVSYARYIGKFFWPFDLAVFYPPPPSWPTSIVLSCAAVMVSITLVAIRIRQSAPYVLIGWLWFGGMLLPVIGLVQVGRQAMADRYMYLPHIGLLIMIAWAAAAWSARSEQARKWVVTIASALTLAFAMRASDQTRHWENTTTLFDHAMAVTPENAVTLNQVGNARLREKNPAAAEVLYRRALALEPDYGMAHLNLGNLLVLRREFEQAARHFESAIRWRPDLARAHLGLAIARSGLKQYTLADESFVEALRLAPHLPEVHASWDHSREERSATSAPAPAPAPASPAIR